MWFNFRCYLNTLDMRHFLNFSAFFLIFFGLSAQSIEGLTHVSPMKNGHIAVQKNSLWGILDSTGTLVINFRNDLIYNENPKSPGDLGVSSLKFPILSCERSIIKKENKGITYYGFIDANGSTVIEPRFLNVSPFE